MKRVILIGSAAIVFVGGALLLLTYEPHQHDTVEYARRLVCQNKQKRIYSALMKYNKEHGTLPSELATLVQRKDIRGNDIYCPTPAYDSNDRRYKYFPQNFGNSNLPLISENAENHSGKGLRLKKLQPVIIETMGDGATTISPLKTLSGD